MIIISIGPLLENALPLKIVFKLLEVRHFLSIMYLLIHSAEPVLFL